MEMHQVRYFLAVSRTLNFTRAAEECNVTQPALTRAVQHLEEEMGAELIRRERNNSHLTELGRRLVPVLQQCYDSAQSAKSIALEFRSGQASTLSFAVSRNIDIGLLKSAIANLTKAFNGLSLNIRRGTRPEIVEMLKDGEVELAVAGPIGDAWDRLDDWPLFSEQFELLVNARHPLANRNQIEFDTLHGEKFLVQGDCELIDDIVFHLNGIGVSAADMHQVASSHDLRDLVAADLGIAIVPANTSPPDAAIRHIPLSGLALEWTVTAYSVAGRRRSTCATTLLNMLRASDWLAQRVA